MKNIKNKLNINTKKEFQNKYIEYKEKNQEL